jgi:hypothetical protein
VAEKFTKNYKIFTLKIKLKKMAKVAQLAQVKKFENCVL